ncbi:MAG: VTT domain-containing protein [Bryobacterales bacterium]
MLKEFARWAVALGPWGIFLVSLSDSALIPMPQGVDALLIAQAVAAPSTAYFAAALAVVGSVLGSLILYYLARRGGQVMLEKKASKSGVEKMRRQVEEYGAMVLFLPTALPLPLPMKLFVIAAGVFQMRLTAFCAVLLVARSIRYFGEAYIGVRYGEQATTFLKENALFGLGIALAIIAAFYVVHRWSTSRLNQT